MRARFERRGMRMPPVNEKQADFLTGARVLENPRGTAPGFWAAKDGVEIVILPGVPSEMREIMEDRVLPELRQRAQGRIARRRVLKIGGMGESRVEELVAPVYARFPDHPVTILAGAGEVQLHLCVRGSAEEVETVLEAMEGEFRAVLGERIYGRDEEGLPEAVGRVLRERGLTLSLAESCTGGLVSALLTEVPGSSDYFLGSVVSYANSAKETLLDVEPETLRRGGAVSEEVAREMARGARARFGSTVAAAVTGIAGPLRRIPREAGRHGRLRGPRTGRSRDRQEAHVRRGSHDHPPRGVALRPRADPAEGRGGAVTGEPTVRAFLAVPPDPGWAESVRELVSRLRPSLPSASWTRPASWHLTLKFLGEVPRERLDALIAAFALACLGARAGRAGGQRTPGPAPARPGPRPGGRILGNARARRDPAARRGRRARRPDRGGATGGPAVPPARHPGAGAPAVELVATSRPTSGRSDRGSSRPGPCASASSTPAACRPRARCTPPSRNGRSTGSSARHGHEVPRSGSGRRRVPAGLDFLCRAARPPEDRPRHPAGGLGQRRGNQRAPRARQDARDPRRAPRRREGRGRGAARAAGHGRPPICRGGRIRRGSRVTSSPSSTAFGAGRASRRPSAPFSSSLPRPWASASPFSSSSSC